MKALTELKGNHRTSSELSIFDFQTNDSNLFGDSWRTDNPVPDTDPLCEPTCTEGVPEPECSGTVAATANASCAVLATKFAVRDFLPEQI